MTMSTVVLPERPATASIYTRAALGALPVIGAHGSSLPTTEYDLLDQHVDRGNLADYARATGQRLADHLSLTYPFVLTFPVVMKLMVDKGFPFPAIGMVHVQNVIERRRPIEMMEPLDIRVHAENLREHRKGLLVDLVSEVSVGRELVWRQVSSFLRQQKTSLSGTAKEPAPKVELPEVPQRTLKVDQAIISRYAAVSGDRNPIHVSTLGAKAFGFPRTIAHGMWGTAAMLAAVEGSIPAAARYDVRFGRPIVLPATVNLYADRTDGGWDLALRNRKTGDPHITASLDAL